MRRSSAILSLILSATFLLTSVAPTSAVPSGTVGEHRDKAVEARRAAEKAEAEAARLAEEAEALDAQISLLSDQLSALRPRVTSATQRSARLRAEVYALRAKIATKQAQIARTSERLANQQSLLADRVEGTYKRGELFYLDILLGADDLTDLIARTALVQRVISSDQQLVQDMEQTRFELMRARTELDQDLRNASLKRAEAEAEQRVLEQLEAERHSSMVTKTAAETAKRALVAENKADATRLRALADAEERAAAEIEEELRRRASSGDGRYDGIMAWPTPGHTRITSSYGWRVHPVLGDRRLHRGIDIGAPTGATIVAAGDGIVIFAGVRSGYGNTVMIDHGNGVVTLYAHQSRIAVSDGEVVGQGDKVGEVGSTGLSTGPHLHFEVRVNGGARDPMGYL